LAGTGVLINTWTIRAKSVRITTSVSEAFVSVGASKEGSIAGEGCGTRVAGTASAGSLIIVGTLSASRLGISNAVDLTAVDSAFIDVDAFSEASATNNSRSATPASMASAGTLVKARTIEAIGIGITWILVALINVRASSESSGSQQGSCPRKPSVTSAQALVNSRLGTSGVQITGIGQLAFGDIGTASNGNEGSASS